MNFTLLQDWWILSILTLNCLKEKNYLKHTENFSSALSTPQAKSSQATLKKQWPPCCWNTEEHTIRRKDSLTIICCITVQEWTVVDYSYFRKGKFEAQRSDALFTNKIRAYWFERKKKKNNRSHSLYWLKITSRLASVFSISSSFNMLFIAKS